MIRRCPNKFMRAQLRRLRDDHALIDDADRDVSEAILRAKRSGNSTMLRHEPLDVVALVPPAWLADERRPTNVGQGQRVAEHGSRPDEGDYVFDQTGETALWNANHP